jgi:drug/metabolite transporter (DMT)-like permease
MTGLYPVVTILLAFLVLRETITWTQGAGIALAVASMTLLAL